MAGKGVEIHVITRAYLLQNQAAVWVHTCMMLQAGTARRFPRANYLEVLNFWAYGEKESVHTNSGPSRSIKCRRVTIAIGSSEWLIEWNGTGAMTAQRWGPKTTEKNLQHNSKKFAMKTRVMHKLKSLEWHQILKHHETPDHPSLCSKNRSESRVEPTFCCESPQEVQSPGSPFHNGNPLDDTVALCVITFYLLHIASIILACPWLTTQINLAHLAPQMPTNGPCHPHPSSFLVPDKPAFSAPFGLVLRVRASYRCSRPRLWVLWTTLTLVDCSSRQYPRVINLNDTKDNLENLTKNVCEL